MLLVTLWDIHKSNIIGCSTGCEYMPLIILNEAEMHLAFSLAAVGTIIYYKHSMSVRNVISG